MTPAGIRIHVRLVPRGGRDAVDGVGPDGELRCRVSAPAVDGAANRALLRLLAETLGVAGSAVAIEAGTTARTKRVAVSGPAADELRARWPGIRLL